jgi:hypothetical protein
MDLEERISPSHSGNTVGQKILDERLAGTAGNNRRRRKLNATRSSVFNLKLRQEHFFGNLPLCPIDFATLEIETK